MSEHIFPGDRVGRFEVKRLVAYQGKVDCKSPRCTRRKVDWANGDLGECIGWHCALCDEPCSMMGHNCPRAHEVAA